MSQFVAKSAITDETVSRYVNEKITTENDLEKRLRAETYKLPNGGMISPSDVGQLLAILAQSIQARKAIEVGTFTGYTALKIASALPEGGKLICCDINSDWTAIGRRFWEEAKLAQKIDLRLAPAMQTLNDLLANDDKGAFDFAFIDADKTGYDAYYEACLQLIRPGGLIILDNMLRGGRVANPNAATDESLLAIRSLNEKMSKDPRVSACLLTVGDGLMLARKN